MRQPANAAPRRVTSKFYFRGLFIPAVKSSKHKNISRCPLPHVSNRFLPRSQVSFGFFRACISKLVRHVPFVLGFKQGARKEMAIQTHYRAASCRLFFGNTSHQSGTDGAPVRRKIFHSFSADGALPRRRYADEVQFCKSAQD